ncbi:MAG: cation transporting ATPase C-terminal domain-containing protein, partial [Patescibacteria group bacterium]
KEISRIEKKHLGQIDSIKLIATTIALCRYHKTKPLEDIVLSFFRNCEISDFQIKADYEIISNLPSNEEKKLSTVVALNKDSQEIFAFTKGNPKNILEKCTRLLIDNKKIDITPALRRKLRKKFEKLNKQGQKILASAYKGLPLKRLKTYNENFVENDLVLIGFIGMSDEINTNLIPVIETIKKNNIKIYITTAVKDRYAIAAATDLKIINPQYFESVRGKDLEDISDQKLIKMLSNKEKDYVFSELKSRDRKRIIEALNENKETVAVISKKNSTPKDLIEDIEKSRQIIANNNKLLFHSLSCKIAEIILLIVALVLSAPLPLSIGLILTIDIAINIIIELALRKEKIKTGDDEKITTKTYIHLLSNGICIGLILSAVYIWNLIRFGWYPGETLSLNSTAFLKSSTITFLLFCFIQIINAFNIRSGGKSSLKTNPLSNIYLLMTMIVVILIAYSLTQFTAIKAFLKLESLSGIEWQIILIPAITILIFEEIRKFLLRKNE